jgi:hypothetical protein
LGRGDGGEGASGALTPKEISKLKFADIACGSGSFLIAVYDKVLHYIEKYYNDHPDEAKKAGCVEIDKGIYALSLKQKQQILIDNIFGVDIDHQAVEVAQLSLFLKLLESESAGTAGQLSFEKTKILPDLSKNILNGNSLVEYDITNLFPLSTEDEVKIKPFDFKTSFKSIMDKGGFDAIVGNPPYVRQESLGDFKNYFEKKYKVFQGTADLYTYFIERGTSLLKQEGKLSYIVANKWMRANYGLALRKWIKQNGLSEIIDFGDLKVFKGATTYPCIISLSKGSNVNLIRAVNVTTLEFKDLLEYVQSNDFQVKYSSLKDEGWTLTNEAVYSVLEKIQTTGQTLGQILKKKIYRGILTGLNEAFVIDTNTRDRLVSEDPKSVELIKPLLGGRDLKRYENILTDRYLLAIPCGLTSERKGKMNPWDWFSQSYPAIAKYLEPFAKAAEERWDKGEYWWELRSCAYYEEFSKRKLFLPDISTRGNFAIDESGGFFCVNTVYILCTDDLTLMGILNSRLMTFVYSRLFSTYQGGYLRFFTQYLEQLPIPTIDLTVPTEKNKHDTLVKLVEQMLDTKKRLAAASRDSERTQLERKCEYLDSEIDKVVYELYGLTDEEIGIVEGKQL